MKIRLYRKSKSYIDLDFIQYPGGTKGFFILPSIHRPEKVDLMEAMKNQGRHYKRFHHPRWQKTFIIQWLFISLAFVADKYEKKPERKIKKVK